MVPVFSLMLSRLNGGGSELGEVIGHLPGVVKADLDGDTHAGFVETSQLLALHPEWVDPDYKLLPRRVAASGGGKAGTFLQLLRGVRAGIRHFTAESYSGAPAGASAEAGERILDLLAARTAEAIAEILDGTLPPEQWHSPLWKWRLLFVHPWAVRFFNRLLGVPRTVG